MQSDWESHGSATTLSFNCDNTRLLVGHAKGQVGGAPLAGGRGTANWWEGHTLFAGCASLHVPMPLSCPAHQLVQWDVESAVCLRDVSSAHPRNACILQVKVGAHHSITHLHAHLHTHTCLHIPPSPSLSPTPSPLQLATSLPPQYTDLYNTALFSDISGSIYRLTFK